MTTIATDRAMRCPTRALTAWGVLARPDAKRPGGSLWRVVPGDGLADHGLEGLGAHIPHNVFGCTTQAVRLPELAIAAHPAIATNISAQNRASRRMWLVE